MDIEYPADPFTLFSQWFREASTTELSDPNAMSVATVDERGHPSVRIVLLKVFDSEGFCFFTNTQSRKGQEIIHNPKVCLNFHWKSLQRQVRIYGIANLVSNDEADRYFASRPTGSQIGAWASHQSRPLESRAFLEQEMARYAVQFGDDPIPRPPHWSGFRVTPSRLEFWQERPFRLHDRFIYERMISQETPDSWSLSRLYP